MTRSLVTARAALHDGRLCPPPIKDERYHAYAIACTPDLVAQAVLSVTASGTPGQAAATQLRVCGEAADAAPAYSPSENFAWRELTAADATWSTDLWTPGVSFALDVTDIVSEVVARPGWVDGNPVALQLSPVITGVVEPWSRDGRVTQTAQLAVTYTVPVMEPATTTLRYTYDPLQRVTGVTARGSYSSTWGYVYDEMGNRTSYTRSITSTVVTTYTYNAANQLATARATSDGIVWYYHFDHHGSVIEVTPNGPAPASGALRYQYDQAYRLLAVERYTGGPYSPQASMVYDGAGHRLSMTAWHGTFGVTARYSVDDGAGGAVLTATTGTQSTHYLYGVDGVFAERTSTWGYYLKDGQATVRQMSSTRGAVTLMRRYDPFGEVLEQHGSGTVAWGYFGGLLDAATGLLYLGHGLYYDPATGRLLTPAGPGANPYLPYAPGQTDPLGAMLGPLALIALVALRRRKRGKRDDLADRLVVLAAVLAVTGTGLVACTPTPMPPPPTGNANTPPSTPAGGPTATQGVTPTSTGTAIPLPPTGTHMPTITPCPTPTATPAIQWLDGTFTITHYTFALESDPRYENDPLVSANGLPADKQYRDGFLFGDRGILRQGTGLASDENYITIDWMQGGPNGRETYFTYGVGGSGGTPVAWETVAAGDSRIPIGSHIVVEIYRDRGVFAVNDTGSDVGPGHIDIFVGAITIDEADQLGTRYSRVGLVTNYPTATPTPTP